MALTNKIKEVLNYLDIHPNKTLGQNFLVNEGVYKKILAATEIKTGETILEVGPGLGTLTEYLVSAGANIVAVEKDHKLAEYLKTKFANNKSVKIIEADILKFNPLNTKYWIQNTGYKIVGNIPYYLTSHLIRTIFENWPQPKTIVLMIQKEVAQRIMAKPPEMSMISVLVQYFSKPEIISYVSRGSFFPSPDVDSTVIRLAPQKLNANNTSTENFFKITQIGFSRKRKQLINNLGSGLKLPRNEIESKLLAANIDPKRRAETLTLEEWQKLINSILGNSAEM